MDDFLKMDVFFVVTAVAVFFLGALGVIALVYTIKILKSIDHVAHNVSEESDSMRGDLAVLRKRVRDEGMRWKHVTEFFTGMVSRKRSRGKISEKA